MISKEEGHDPRLVMQSAFVALGNSFKNIYIFFSLFFFSGGGGGGGRVLSCRRHDRFFQFFHFHVVSALQLLSLYYSRNWSNWITVLLTYGRNVYSEIMRNILLFRKIKSQSLWSCRFSLHFSHSSGQHKGNQKHDGGLKSDLN